jgi:outer membrane lipoprotein-sorting protein
VRNARRSSAVELIGRFEAHEGRFVTRRPAARLRDARLRGPTTPGLVLTLVLVCTTCMRSGEAHSAEFGRLLEEMRQAYAWVDHYTTTFLIQERLEGELRPKQQLVLKFKKPFRVYLRWLTGKDEGRQALYPVGVDGNELWVRVPMLVGAITVSLDPQSPRAKKGGRHPITDVGIGRLLDLITDNAYRGLQHGEVTIEDGGPHTTFDRPTHRYTLHFPNDPAKGYYCMTALIDVDREHRLPIYTEIYDWDGQLIERYGYLNLRLNPGLTDEDFNPKNPAYGF